MRIAGETIETTKKNYYMSLRDQPYIPLYVDDVLSDEKLNECSANAHGVYFKLLCLLHKSQKYGHILLNQKYKQSAKPMENFARSLLKHLPFDYDEILSGLNELSYWKVIEYNEDELWQKRMVRDNEISIKRAEAGSKGGKKTQFGKANNEASNEANDQANYVNAIANANEIDNSIYNGVIGEENKSEPKPKTWRDDFEIYRSGLMEVYNQLIIDPVFIRERERYHPTLNISLSLEKAVNDFWGLEAGWKHKKSKRSKEIDWKTTLTKALDLQSNQVKKQYSTITKPKNERFEVNFDGNKDGTFFPKAGVQ